MNWDKSKSLIILFLVALNAFLGVMLFAQEDEHVMGPEDISVITELLAGANIVIDENTSMPMRFDPVDQLIVGEPRYDFDELLRAFFVNSNDTIRTTEFGNTIFANGEGRLTVMQSSVLFEPSPLGGGLSVFRYATEEDLTNFVSSQPSLFPSFVLDATIVGYGDTTMLEFRQHYYGNIVLPNHVAFVIDESGFVSEVRYALYVVEGFVGVPKPIMPPASALFMLALSLGLGTEPLEETTYITYMDMVLQLEQDILTTNPYYRVLTSTHGHTNAPILINALTGDIE